MSQVIPCRFGDGPAVAIYAVSKGCACYPHDREQALCAQHAVNAEPLGTMTLIKDLTQDQAWSKSR